MTEMTPETQNATPENLRKLARLIEMGQPLRAKAASEAIILCVSAWEAERAQATVVLRAYNLARAEILNLHDAIDGKTHLRDAALAAEEKK